MGFTLRRDITDGATRIKYYIDDTEDGGKGTAGRHYLRVDDLAGAVAPLGLPAFSLGSGQLYMAIPFDPGDQLTRVDERTDPNAPIIFALTRVSPNP